MIERFTIDVAPPVSEPEGTSDDDPGPSPAGVVILHDAWHTVAGAEPAVHDAVNAAVRFVPELAGGQMRPSGRGTFRF